MPPLIEIRNLSFAYPEQASCALRDVSLSVQQGDFLVLCGPSGCGKTTLLRQLKPAIAPHGLRRGEILFDGCALSALSAREQSARIGFVRQSPEDQIVTDKVWHELAFGLESLGLETPEIRRRVAEMASFFGIEGWFHRSTAALSGGQKQLLNLASVMAMQPAVLILDEPTSQLDPIAAGEFLATLGRINRELGTTVLLSEHRLEQALPLATHAAVLDAGALRFFGAPREVGLALREQGHSMFLAMPAALRIWALVPQSEAQSPITVREGRDWLARFAAAQPLHPLPPEKPCAADAETVLAAEELFFRYERDGEDVIKGLSLRVQKGEFLALLGGNGTGKTTCLKLLAGLLQPTRGSVQRAGSIGLLPQNPQTLFVRKTLRADLFEIFSESALPPAEQAARVARVVALCRLEALLERHPYDLSGGEQQRAALAKLLLCAPDVLLLDEPTKGLDAQLRQSLAQLLSTLCARGTTVVVVSHDVEFCARYARRCALLFDGAIVAEGAPRRFFSGNRFYTTAANRIARELAPEAVTVEDVVALCTGAAPPPPEMPPEPAEPLPPPPPEAAAAQSSDQTKLPLWRRALAALSAAVAAVLLCIFLRTADLSALLGSDGLSALAPRTLWLYAAFLADLLLFAFAAARRAPAPPVPPALKKQPLSRRTRAALALCLLLIPLTLLLGEFSLGGRKYYFISLLLLLECMLPFFLVFEGRRPQPRELTVIAVLCAVGVAGRMVFFMLPEFKPVVALVILAGVAFGGETGFLVGAVTMLVSNLLFSQGPWTPWQMFAMGLVGFLAGLLFRKGLLRRTRWSLCIFGALASIVVYGGITNLQAALQWTHALDRGVLLSYYLTGFPIDCVRAAATWLFLWFGAAPVLEKLDRIKVKYGLVE